ncbi:sugar phosphate isomerase/epimerase family protein [Streptomyces sp. NPDC056716]|uniref:sugar phosphate isomerase/epimerase family protein n=1 Tax=unclassified Streptomyces TaxID=2593676 RepID=UPI0036850283
MSEPKITLGINTCFAVKRWTRPEQWARIITDELGLGAAQFSLDLLPPSFGTTAALDHAAEVRDIAGSHGIRVNSVFTGLGAYGSNLLLSDSPTERDSAERWYEQVIAVTAAMGAHGTGGHLGAFTVPSFRDPVRHTELWADLVRRLRRLSTHAHGAGLDYLLFENLAVNREPGHSIPEAHQLETDLSGTLTPWRLCLDLGHPAALRTGSTSDQPVAWLHEQWRHTPVVQLQQSPRGSDHHGAFTAGNNLDGLVHRDEVLPALLDWTAPEIELYLEIIPAHEADDDAVLRDLIESVTYWRDGIDNLTA